ncbi:MAG: hypoxanthine phosphoribosyltransferase [Bacteroidales bacterium]|jgi:hypoxanthine phosphoribosyltransferase|nr:hypoxanthine phosphoribosyltransferase [Bacteroidales bacterium]
MKEVIIKDKTFIEYITPQELSIIIEELSIRINNDYKDKEPVFLVVLNGAFIFASDLLRNINFLPNISFIKLSSYQATSSTGKVKELIGLNEIIKDKDIIIIEDIVETGKTMEELLNILKEKQPSSIEICSLFLKPKIFNKDFEVKYVGKQIDNSFIVGYGFDYSSLGRNLKGVYKLK